MKVGGDSIDGKSVYLNHTFLYRLDSSILPPDRAYQTVTDWGGTDQLATEYDQYLGNWAVYASRDLYRDGQVLAARGEKIAAAASTPRSSAATCSPWTPTTTARSRSTRPRPTSTW